MLFGPEETFFMRLVFRFFFNILSCGHVLPRLAEFVQGVFGDYPNLKLPRHCLGGTHGSS